MFFFFLFSKGKRFLFICINCISLTLIKHLIRKYIYIYIYFVTFYPSISHVLIHSKFHLTLFNIKKVGKGRGWGLETCDALLGKILFLYLYLQKDIVLLYFFDVYADLYNLHGICKHLFICM